MSNLSPDRLHVPDSAPRWADRLVRLLVEFRVGVYLAMLSATALLVSGRWSLPSIPPGAVPYLQGFAIGIIPCVIAGKLLFVNKYMPDRRYNVLVFDVPEVDVDLGEIDDHRDLRKAMSEADAGKFDVYGKKVPRGLWQERERGDWPAWKPPGNVDRVVTSFEYDPDAHKLAVDGVNPELANPASIAARDGMLSEIYSVMLTAVQELNQMEASLEAKSLEIQRNDVNALLEAVEYGTSFDPEQGALDVVRSDRWSDDADADDRDDGRTDETRRPERPTVQDVLEVAQGQQQAATDGGRDQ